ncbi:hypothetical protein T484DRAFT_1797080 [Baffinella frigidus]|nr:hypothetical protein T484DRAFT_1797080 [Cryptophyta sp. CCMP2293]
MCPPEDVTDGSDAFLLHYTSTRGPLLAPFVKGLVCAISTELYKTEADIRVETNDTGAVFHIQMPTVAAEETAAAPAGAEVAEEEELGGYERGAALLADRGMDLSFLLRCWPFYILINQDMTIAACGLSLSERVPAVLHGGRFDEIFKVVRPLLAAEDVDPGP